MILELACFLKKCRSPRSIAVRLGVAMHPSILTESLRSCNKYRMPVVAKVVYRMDLLTQFDDMTAVKNSIAIDKKKRAELNKETQVLLGEAGALVAPASDAMSLLPGRTVFEKIRWKSAVDHIGKADNKTLRNNLQNTLNEQSNRTITHSRHRYEITAKLLPPALEANVHIFINGVSDVSNFSKKRCTTLYFVRSNIVVVTIIFTFEIM